MRAHRVLVALLVGAVFAGPPAAVAATVPTTTLRYGSGMLEGGRSKTLLADVYRPSRQASRPRPVVVLVHGGAFTHGTRKDPNIVRIARGLVAHGIVVVAIDYRLHRDRPVPAPRMARLSAALGTVPLGPAVVAAVDDTLTAIHFVRERHRRLGVDPRRLALIGSSAGGITVDEVAYALDDYGLPRPKVRFVGGLWGGFLLPNPASSIPAADMLEAGEPPLFAVHGDHDHTVPVQLDDRLVARARAVGVPVRYDRVAGGTHGYAGTGFFTKPAFGQQTAFAHLLSETVRWLR